MSGGTTQPSHMSPGGESTVVSYASFLAGRATAPSEDELSLIFRRIGFKKLADIEAFLAEGPPRFDETYPFLDQVPSAPYSCPLTLF